MATSTYQNMSFDQLVNELAYLKKTWTADNKDYINGLAADVRFVAAMKGFDTKKLEQEAVKKATGREPNASDWAGYETAMKIVNASVAIGKLKQQWSPGNTASAEEAQKLRVEYRTQGLSLREIEAYAMQYADPKHKTPTADELEYSLAQGARAADYAGRLAIVQQEWNDAKNNPNLSAAQKKAAQDAAHQKAQNIRIQALQDGQDVWAVEDLAFYNVNGRPMTDAERKVAAAYIDPLISQYGKKPTGGSTGSTTTTPKTSAPTRTRTGNGETFSGADMVVYMAFPNARPVYLGTATTISYTMFREKKQIRTVGKIGPRGFAKGPRTISGRMIFTVINEHLVEMIKREVSYLRQYKYLFMDELPPFDIIVSFGNEYGGAANMMITGVTIVDEQKTLSIEDLFIENIFTYLARDLQVMRDMNINIKEPYTPLDILSTYFNALGSEMVGNFKIDDLVLSEKAQAVTGYNPFTVMPETYQYTWLDQIAQLEAPVDNGGGTSVGYQVPVFIQVYDTRTKKLLTQGSFDINGESPAWDMILSHASKDLKYWSANSLKAGSDGKYYGYFEIMDIAPGSELQVAWTREGYTQVTKTVTASQQGTYLLIETESSVTNTKDEIGWMVENNEAEEWSGKKSPGTVQGYVDYSKIKVKPSYPLNNTYDKNKLTSVEHVKDLSKYQLTPLIMSAGGPVSNWPIYISWELSKAIVDGTDNWYDWTDGDDAKKLNAIHKDGYFSSTINPKLGKPKEVVIRTIDSANMGYAEINPDDIFATMSTTGATLKWKDMPEGMLLYIKCYTDSRIGTGRWPGYLMYVFRRNN